MTAPLIGLVGAKRSGKDTFAGLLAEEHGFRRLAFADRLKAVAYASDPLIPDPATGLLASLGQIVRLSSWETAKETPEVRRFLQNLGVAVRKHLGESAWIDPVIAEALTLRLDGYGSLGEYAPGTPVVITDVRFPNEVDAIRNSGGVIVKVVRPGIVPDDAHVSEALAWDESLIPWRTVVNNGTIEAMRSTAHAFGAAALRGAW